MTLIAIVGATGTGKSDFALDLAEAFDRVGRVAEVVNADAMQLYRGMDIGTAKLPLDERRGMPHHLLDVLDVTDEASAAAYQPDARAAIDDILARDGVALLVGGSRPLRLVGHPRLPVPGHGCRGPRAARGGARRDGARAPARATARGRPRDGGERRTRRTAAGSCARSR